MTSDKNRIACNDCFSCEKMGFWCSLMDYLGWFTNMDENIFLKKTSWSTRQANRYCILSNRRLEHGNQMKTCLIKDIWCSLYSILKVWQGGFEFKAVSCGKYCRLTQLQRCHRCIGETLFVHWQSRLVAVMRLFKLLLLCSNSNFTTKTKRPFWFVFLFNTCHHPNENSHTNDQGRHSSQTTWICTSTKTAAMQTWAHTANKSHEHLEFSSPLKQQLHTKVSMEQHSVKQQHSFHRPCPRLTFEKLDTA